MKADKRERIEVRLRSTVPTEAALIDELTKLEGTYGGMNELMRKCLVRGFLLLEKRLQDVSASSGEMAALDALAKAFDSEDCDHRLLKTFLDARSSVKGVGTAQGLAAPAIPQGATETAFIQEVQTIQDVSSDQAALAQVVKPETAMQGLKAPEQVPGTAEATEIEPSPKEEHIAPAPKKAHDWTALRNVAGVAASSGAAKAGGGKSEGGE